MGTRPELPRPDAVGQRLGLYIASEIPGNNGATRRPEADKRYQRTASGLLVSRSDVHFPGEGFIPHGDLFIPAHVRIDSTLLEFDLSRHKDYFVRTPSGEQRFNFESDKHTETISYINDIYDRFKVSTAGNLMEVAEEYGATTVDEVREKMMNNGHNLPFKNGKLLLPYDFHMPNKGQFDGDFFYWDNLWSVMWAVTRNEPEFAKGVIDNWKYEFKPFGYIPNSNRLKIANKSQSPVAALAYRTIEPSLPDTEENRLWKQDTIAFLKSEYFNTWVDDPEGESKYNTYTRYKGGHSDAWKNQARTPTGLSRYSDADLPENHDNAECASTEDYTPRFGGKAGHYNATDLAGFLGIYEKLFEDAAVQEGNFEEAAHWRDQFEKRARLVNDLMWNEEKGWYMDYNFETGKQSDVMALAGFTIAYAGMAPPERLHRMVQNLDKFKLPYGLAVTTGEEGTNPSRKEQWKWPNVWSPRQDLVVETLMQYPEYQDMAEEIMVRSMIGCAEFRAKYNTLPETRDGRTGLLGGASWYQRKEDEEGFMWTAVEYLKNTLRLQDIYSRKDLALAV